VPASSARPATSDSAVFGGRQLPPAKMTSSKQSLALCDDNGEENGVGRPSKRLSQCPLVLSLTLRKAAPYDVVLVGARSHFVSLPRTSHSLS